MRIFCRVFGKLDLYCCYITWNGIEKKNCWRILVCIILFIM